LGAVFPDIDTISLWSRFDSTFGRLFSLNHSGQAIYSAKFWYSHHAFFHSIAASILFALLFMIVLYLISCIRTSSVQPFFGYFKKNIAFFSVFVLGYWMHFLGDFPTSGSAWGGINLFYPVKNYVGGLGKIWWWNNYDIFLILLVALFVNVVILIISNWLKFRAVLFCNVVIAVAFITICIQVNSRKTDYAYTGHTSKYNYFEIQSKKEQERILGTKLYDKMSKFDEWVKVNF